MQKSVGVCVALFVASLLVGCSTPSGYSKHMLEMYKIYQSQPHEVENFHMIAAEGESITISGIHELRVATAATPRQILSRDPSTQQQLIGLGKDIVKSAATTLIGLEALKQLGSKPQTVNPVIVEKEVLVPESSL